MRQALSAPPSGAIFLLLQPRDDGLAMYTEFLCYHGLEVIGVSDPRAALIAAPKAHVNVTGILLVGSMDGVELIARLRHDQRTHRTPIIVLIACAWTMERERAEHAGCDVFLSKPCLSNNLLRHVHQLPGESTLDHVRGTPLKASLLNEPRGASVSLPIPHVSGGAVRSDPDESATADSDEPTALSMCQRSPLVT